MQDAIFIVGDDYATFQEAVDALKTTFALVSKQSPQVRSFRFSIAGDSPGAEFFPKAKLKQYGYMYANAIASVDFTSELIEQSQALNRSHIPYRMTSDHFFKHGTVQLLSDGKKSFISIPFEDKVENTSRFFGQYIPCFADHLKMPASTIKKEFERFYEHCAAHLMDEKPFSLEPKQMLGLIKPPTTFIFTPKKGQVGRHTIFKELEIFQPESSMKHLVPVFCSMIQLGRRQQAELYFQYFLSPDQNVEQTISKKHLRESTYDIDPLTYQEWMSGVKTLAETKITDVFCVLEHQDVTLEHSCSVLYTIRKIQNQGFELRANVIWKQATTQEPESLIAPFEERSDLSWTRIA